MVGVFLLAPHAGHGLHRPGDAFRSGRVLGARHRRVDHGPRAAHWGPAGAAHARRPDHRRAKRCRAFSRFTFSSFPACCSPSSACICCMVLKLGINEWPMPGRMVNAKPTCKEYHEAHAEGRRAVRPGCVREGSRLLRHDHAGLARLRRLVSARSGPTARPIPTIIQTAPVPDFFFLWIFAALALLPPNMETPLLLVGPVVGLAVLLGSLPFMSRDRARKAGAAGRWRF